MQAVGLLPQVNGKCVKRFTCWPAPKWSSLLSPWSGFCWACLPPGVVCAWAVPMEVVPLGVFLPGRASFLRKWSRRVCFCRGVPLSFGSGLAGCVSAGRPSRLGVVCAWAVPPEVVSPSVFLPEVVALEVPPGGGVWRPDVAFGRWNRPVCRLELAGLRAGSSFVAKKRKL